MPETVSPPFARPTAAAGVSAPQPVVPHFAPPTARELRTQAVQRVQVGLFGIAAILLLVGLASIINDRARLNEGTLPGNSASAPASNASTNSDPLADAGVMPSTAPTPDRTARPGAR